MELKTFRTIFEPYIDKETGKEIKIEKIEIPKIQRDFAYGRKDPKNIRRRNSFLESLYSAVLGNSITLDFIYGDVKDNVLYPLDGQQRLTILFLLYWFASKKEIIECDFLNKFSYNTRHSARDFCSRLIEFQPELNKKLSDEIQDEHWFPLEWKHDATISSMLVMLDDIQEKFFDITDLFNKLENISFYFLPIGDMGLTDEIYIKMNSRGKPLTQFEHFKAELEKQIKNFDEQKSKEIGSSIDKEWTDLLWNYKNNDNTVDDEFLRYFRFICDIICYKNNESPKITDEFDLIKKYFSKSENNELNKIKENINLFCLYFNCWLDNSNKSINIADFFSKFVSNEHEVGKIKIRYELNLFQDCLQNYADVQDTKNRKFTLPQIILLFSFITYRLNIDKITECDFRRRIRIVNNLVLNSQNELSDSEVRSSGNRMPVILRQVEKIIIEGKISEEENGFNSFQIKEEIKKLQWTQKNSNLSESLFKLEDHKLLDGQISIISLDNSEYFERFESLFNCSWDSVDKALLSIGDYSQKDHQRIQLGSKCIDEAWKFLFHRSEKKEDKNTSKILKELLSKEEKFTDEKLNLLSENYLKECEENKEFSWRYYYIKYDLFRPGRYGKYWVYDSLYKINALFQKQKPSQNSYDPFLKEIGESSRDYYGERIIIGDKYFCSGSNSLEIYDLNSEELIDKIEVLQNDKGIDVENRIEKFRKEIKSYVEKK